uniref:Uncharacterized protein n=1 Tax=Neospora caninum (strain Liverpool) TaxID=572307 RepID=A0A0F7U4S5_NEOCL|nr:TPA: hypothetical protein BN1204_006474 [Neospora caninum Liverpool]
MDDASIAAALEAELASIETPSLSPFPQPESAAFVSESSLTRQILSVRRQCFAPDGGASVDAHTQLTFLASSGEPKEPIQQHLATRRSQKGIYAFRQGSLVSAGAAVPSRTPSGVERGAGPPQLGPCERSSRERSPRNDVGCRPGVSSFAFDGESRLRCSLAETEGASGDEWYSSAARPSPVGTLQSDGETEEDKEGECDGGLSELLSVQSEIQKQLIRVQEATLSDCRAFSRLAARAAGGARSLQNPGVYRRNWTTKPCRNTTGLSASHLLSYKKPKSETGPITDRNRDGPRGDSGLPPEPTAPVPRFLCSCKSAVFLGIRRVSSARKAQDETHNCLPSGGASSARARVESGKCLAPPGASTLRIKKVWKRRARTDGNLDSRFPSNPAGELVNSTNAQFLSRAKKRNRHSLSADDFRSVQNGAMSRPLDANSPVACCTCPRRGLGCRGGCSSSGPLCLGVTRRPPALSGESGRSVESRHRSPTECALTTLKGFLEAGREPEEADYVRAVLERYACRLRRYDEDVAAIDAEAKRRRGPVDGEGASAECKRRQAMNKRDEKEDLRGTETPRQGSDQHESFDSAGSSDAVSSQKFPFCMSRDCSSTSACLSLSSPSVALAPKTRSDVRGHPNLRHVVAELRSTVFPAWKAEEGNQERGTHAGDVSTPDKKAPRFGNAEEKSGESPKRNCLSSDLTSPNSVPEASAECLQNAGHGEPKKSSVEIERDK